MHKPRSTAERFTRIRDAVAAREARLNALVIAALMVLLLSEWLR